MQTDGEQIQLIILIFWSKAFLSINLFAHHSLTASVTRGCNRFCLYLDIIALFRNFFIRQVVSFYINLLRFIVFADNAVFQIKQIVRLFSLFCQSVFYLLFLCLFDCLYVSLLVSYFTPMSRLSLLFVHLTFSRDILQNIYQSFYIRNIIISLYSNINLIQKPNQMRQQLLKIYALKTVLHLYTLYSAV